MNNIKPVLLYGINLYNNTNEENLLYILAYIIDNCNYTCSYCYNIKPYKKINLDIKKLYDYIYYIRQIYPKKNISLELIGGEPTLHPDLLWFCEKTKHFSNFTIKIFTNLSATIDFFEKILVNKNIILIASWHSLYVDKLNIKFIDNAINLLKKYKNRIEVRIMYELQNTDNSINVAKQLLPYVEHSLFDLSYIFDSTNQKNDLLKYSYEQIKEFDIFHDKYKIRSNTKEFFIKYNNDTYELKSFSEMFCNKSFSFKHWLCNAGKNSLFINYDGLVYPCVEYSFDIKNAVFNIRNKLEYKKYNFKQTICKLDFCSCDWDIKKQKIFNKK